MHADIAAIFRERRACFNKTTENNRDRFISQSVRMTSPQLQFNLKPVGVVIIMCRLRLRGFAMYHILVCWI